MMESVFVGGSRKLSRLHKDVRARLDNIISKGFRVLVGDANGADRATQAYLLEKGYENVVVYCTETTCRNNLAGWQVKSIPFAGDKKGGFKFYTAKDDAMAEDADFGLMLWDGKSKGTLRNILNLAERSKKTVVYFSPDRRFLTVSCLDEVKTLLTLCDAASVERFKAALNLGKRLDPRAEQIPLPSA